VLTSQAILDRFRREFNGIVTMDETWIRIYEYAPETKEHSMEMETAYKTFEAERHGASCWHRSSGTTVELGLWTTSQSVQPSRRNITFHVRLQVIHCGDYEEWRLLGCSAVRLL
jgi:hypothetical protein